MTRTDRAVQLLALAAARPARARFAEEWQADLAAGRAIGLSGRRILLAAARVAAFLLRVRIREAWRRRPGRLELLAIGSVCGAAAVVADLPVERFAPVILPFVVLATGRRVLQALRAWVRR